MVVVESVSWSGLGDNDGWRTWGAAASGLAMAGGMVTKRDLDTLRIDHALAMGLPNLDSETSEIAAGRWAFPAQRSRVT